MGDYISGIRKHFKRMQRLLSNEESNKKELTLYHISDTDPKNIEQIRKDVEHYNKGIREQWEVIETGLGQWLERNDHKDIAPSNAQPHTAIEQEINLKVIPIPRESEVDLYQVIPILEEFKKLEQNQYVNSENLQIIKNEYLEYVNPPEDQNPHGGGGHKEDGSTETRKRGGEDQLRKRGKHAKTNTDSVEHAEFTRKDLDELLGLLSGENFQGSDTSGGAAPAARASLPSVWHVV
jgi:hypothetical protein